MTRLVSCVIAVGAALLALGCVSPQEEGLKTMDQKQVATDAVDHHEVWFKGTVEQAFAAARNQDKPIFLYWGAVWCPPCNELKAEVFSKVRFAELMESFVPVYLDGDTEAAQLWSDRLKVSGYPTILVLNQKGEETMRIMETISIEEFDLALASAVTAKRPVKDTIKVALSGKATDQDWRVIAYLSWSQVQGLDLSSDEQLKALRDLANRVPQKLVVEHALLASRVLEAAATADDDATKLVASAIRKDANTYLDAMFANKGTRRVARGTLAYMSEEIVTWLYPEGKGAGYDVLKGRWLAAAEELRLTEALSIDNRLWANHPVVVFAQKDHPKGPLPSAVKELVIREAELADGRAKTHYQRHSVISGAVDLLGVIGEYDRARALLDKELATTDTPWYYESSYASIEKKAGNELAALKWSEKARLSAKGRASKLQWIVSDLVAVAKTKVKDEQRLADLTKEYYTTAFSLADGFSGRNATRAKTVIANLKPYAKTGQVAAVVQTYAVACKEGRSKDGSKCADHFAAMVK